MLRQVLQDRDRVRDVVLGQADPVGGAQHRVVVVGIATEAEHLASGAEQAVAVHQRLRSPAVRSGDDRHHAVELRGVRAGALRKAVGSVRQAAPGCASVREVQRHVERALDHPPAGSRRVRHLVGRRHGEVRGRPCDRVSAWRRCACAAPVR